MPTTALGLYGGPRASRPTIAPKAVVIVEYADSRAFVDQIELLSPEPLDVIFRDFLERQFEIIKTGIENLDVLHKSSLTEIPTVSDDLLVVVLDPSQGNKPVLISKADLFS